MDMYNNSYLFPLFESIEENNEALSSYTKTNLSKSIEPIIEEPNETLVIEPFFKKISSGFSITDITDLDETSQEEIIKEENKPNNTSNNDFNNSSNDFHNPNNNANTNPNTPSNVFINNIQKNIFSQTFNNTIPSDIPFILDKEQPCSTCNMDTFKLMEQNESIFHKFLNTDDIYQQSIFGIINALNKL